MLKVLKEITTKFPLVQVLFAKNSDLLLEPFTFF